jgi:hypothetical protein
MIKRPKLFSLQTVVAAIMLLLLLFYPFETTVAPTWEITVVAEDEHPRAGIFVEETWQNYSLESKSHEERLYTNANGTVTFPRRTIRSSAVWRTLGPVRSLLSAGVHASFGPSAFIIAVGNGIQGYVACQNCQSNEMHSRIVMRQMGRSRLKP